MGGGESQGDVHLFDDPVEETCVQRFRKCITRVLGSLHVLWHCNSFVVKEVQEGEEGERERVEEGEERWPGDRGRWRYVLTLAERPCVPVEIVRKQRAFWHEPRVGVR